MPLTIGTDSYVTAAEYVAYATDYGLTVPTDTTQTEINLRKAFLYITTSYDWIDGWDTSGVPQAVKDAQSMMASYFIDGSDPFAATEGGSIKRTMKKVDVLEKETEYFDGTSGNQLEFSVIDRMLAPYVTLVASGDYTLSIPISGRID